MGPTSCLARPFKVIRKGPVSYLNSALGSLANPLAYVKHSLGLMNLLVQPDIGEKHESKVKLKE